MFPEVRNLHFCPVFFQPSNLAKYLFDCFLEYLSIYYRIKAECNQFKSNNGLNQIKAVNQSMNQSTNQPITSNSSITQIRLTNRSINQSIHQSDQPITPDINQTKSMNRLHQINSNQTNQSFNLEIIQIKSIQSINSNQLNQSLSQSD